MLTDPTEIADIVLLHGGGAGGLIPRGTRVEVFSRIFDVFLVLGTLVGAVVIGYMSWKAYRYRHGGGHVDDAVDRPVLGEVPSGSGGGSKLFVSFGMSAIIVVSLIAWTYGTLLFVEQSPPVDAAGEEADYLEVRVVGQQFSWTYVYPNGHESDTLRVPRDADVHLVVTSNDVFHNFGIPALRVKTDAIPGQTTDTWFLADETGTYRAHCYELCGAGHSYMDSKVVVMQPGAFEEWYANTSAPNGSSSDGGSNATTSTVTPAGTDTTGSLATDAAPAASGVGA